MPESWSKYFTGETFWALTLLHRAFPDGGYGDAAERIAHYIATERREVEGFQPDVPDHWAAYGFAVMTTWPGWELPDEYLPYVRRQSGLQSLQIRYESQRTNSLFSYRTRGRQTLGAGLGTIGEALSNWEIVAGATPALADIREPLAERARCVGGVLVDRQVGADDVAADDDPAIVHGAWFQFDVTQMDDQQHALSALLGAAGADRRRHRELGGRRRCRDHGPRRAPACSAAPRRARRAASRDRRRARRRRRRPGVRRHATARRSSTSARRRWRSAPGSSSPCGRRWRSCAGTTSRRPTAIAGGLVPLLFPIVLTPVVGVTVVAVAARNGWWLPVLATAIGAVPIAVAAAGRPLARRQWRLLSAAIGAVVGVVMIVDGALAV